MINQNVDFTYYKPINDQQKEFHESKSRHKLLLGGYGSGKTYPAIHETFFCCLDNPGNQFLVARNTWESLNENVEREMIEIGNKVGIIKEFNKTKHDLVLINDTAIRFRPLSLSRAQLKGLNICGFFIDDPDVNRFKETISFLYTRLRNTPVVKTNYFQTIITGNYEGHNWLWQQYIRGRDEGGDDTFAYWIIPTGNNPTLPENFIEDLEKIHSQAWMDRFVFCKMDSYAGLVYDEYDFNIHDKDLRWCEEDKDLIKILAIDVGITDPTVVLKMATDFKNIYIYGETYRPMRLDALGSILQREKQKEKYRAIIIDPSAKRKEQTSDSNVRDDLRRDFGITTIPGKNAIDYGIEIIKTLLTVRDGEPHLYIDPHKCPNTVKEMEVYSWKEPSMSEFDELGFKEKPIDKDNHSMDAIRYGVLYLKRFLRGILNKDIDLNERNKKYWEEKHSKLKMYREMPSMIKDYETRKHVEIHQKARRSVNFNHNFG